MTKRILIFVTLLFALLGIIFVTETRKKNALESVEILQQPSSAHFLFGNEQSIVMNFKIVTETGEMLELERGELGLWVAVQPEDADVPQGTVEAAVSQLRSLPVLADNLPLSESEVGVRDQAIQVSVSFSDGENSRFQIGDPTPSGQGYYIRSANGSIRIIEKDSLDTFLKIMTYFGF